MEPDDRLEAVFQVDGVDVSLEAGGWTLVRQFVDILLRALRAMPNGPNQNREVYPTYFADDCLGVGLSMKRTHADSVYELFGSRDSWTRKQQKETEPLRHFLRGRVLTCQGVGIQQLLRMTEDAGVDRQVPTLTSHVTRYGMIFEIGGSGGKVDLRLIRPLESIHAHIGREHARELAARGLLYDTVRFNGLERREQSTGDLLAFELDVGSVTRIPKLGTVEVPRVPRKDRALSASLLVERYNATGRAR